MTHYVEFYVEDVSVNVLLAFVFYLFNLKFLSSICLFILIICFFFF